MVKVDMAKASGYVFVVALWLSCAGADHVTSSTYKLTSLVHREQTLLDHLAEIATLASTLPQLNVSREQIAKLNRTIETLRQRHAPLQTDPTAVQHPVVAFRFIRRLAADWNRVTNGARTAKPGNIQGFLENNLHSIRHVMSKWRTWPTSSSVEDAAIGLIRISHVYSLYPAPYTVWGSTSSSIVTAFGKQCTAVEDDKVNFTLPTSHTRSHSALWLKNQVFPPHCSPYFSKQMWNKEFDDTLSWLNPSMVTEKIHIRENNRETTLKVKNPTQSKEQVKFYTYNSLSTKDLRYIAKIAWNNKHCKEAKVWAKLAEISRSRAPKLQTKGVDFESIYPTKNFERDPKPAFFSDGCSGKEEFNSYNDKIYRQYIKLCQQSAEESLSGDDHKKRCTWRYIWPYVRLDEEVISSNPEVSRFYGVISSGDIEHMKELALNQLSDSELSSDVRDNIKDLRVSQTAWLPNKTPTLEKLSKLVGDATRLDSGVELVDSPSEVFQVVNYGLGGLYAPHEDSVRTSRDMGAETTRHLKNSGDRVATWMFYLSDVQLGGATVFPALNISVAPIK
ncbi:prolyl 4-hydroxylase subunit alpha-1-like, partial [Elysia marginata]